MKKLTPEEVERRLKLYKMGLTDKLAAEKLGIHCAAYSLWRREMGLPANRKKRSNEKILLTAATGTRMENVLSPEQCKAMRLFLGHLLKAHKMNPNLNVGEFIGAYRMYLHGYKTKQVGMS